MSGICPPIKNNLYDHSCALPKVLHIYTKFLRRKQLNCVCVQAEKSGNIKAERCIYYNLLHLEIILTFPSWLSSWSNYSLVLINTAFLVHNCSASATRTAKWKQKCRDTLWVFFFFGQFVISSVFMWLFRFSQHLSMLSSLQLFLFYRNVYTLTAQDKKSSIE